MPGTHSSLYPRTPLPKEAYEHVGQEEETQKDSDRLRETFEKEGRDEGDKEEEDDEEDADGPEVQKESAELTLRQGQVGSSPSISLPAQHIPPSFPSSRSSSPASLGPVLCHVVVGPVVARSQACQQLGASHGASRKPGESGGQQRARTAKGSSMGGFDVALG